MVASLKQLCIRARLQPCRNDVKTGRALAPERKIFVTFGYAVIHSDLAGMALNSVLFGFLAFMGALRECIRNCLESPIFKNEVSLSALAVFPMCA